MICELDAIGGDDQVLDAHVQAHGDPRGGELRNIHLSAAEGYEKLPAAGDGDGGIEDAPLDHGGNLGFDPA